MNATESDQINDYVYGRECTGMIILPSFPVLDGRDIFSLLP